MGQKTYFINIMTNRGNVINSISKKMTLNNALLFASGVFYGLSIKTKFPIVELYTIENDEKKTIKIYEKQHLYKKSKIMLKHIDDVTAKHKDYTIEYVLNENENERVGNGYCDIALIKLKNEIIKITHYGQISIEKNK